MTDDRATDVTFNSDGGAGGTPLFRLTENTKRGYIPSLILPGMLSAKCKLGEVVRDFQEMNRTYILPPTGR